MSSDSYSKESKQAGAVLVKVLDILHLQYTMLSILTPKQKKRVQEKYEKEYAEYIVFMKHNRLSPIKLEDLKPSDMSLEYHYIRHKNPITDQINMVDPSCEHCKQP